METIKTIIDAVDMLALVALAIGVCRLRLSPVTRIEPTVTAPSVTVTVQPAAPPAVRLLVPADIIQEYSAAGMIQAMAVNAHRAHVLHRQPDGSWQRIGHIECGNRDDQSTWPERLKAELGAEGRAVEWPDGEIQEHA